MKNHKIYLHIFFENVHLTSTSSVRAAQVFQNAWARLKFTDLRFEINFISMLCQFESYA
jgi:hypothetical protein